MRRCWQADLMRYDDGVVAAIITARVNQSISLGYPDNNVDPDHAFIYCRYDGVNWSYSYLGKAGKKLYSSEADYTGLAALYPNDPSTLYISTPYSPIDTNINLGVREIWKGVTSDNGVTWSWTPITQNSVRDNLRPIVPLWDNDNTALLWCRGTYSAAQSFDAAVVGVLDRRLESISKMTYVDADTINTTLATSESLVITGPDINEGAMDNKWHLRTGRGNSGSVLTSAELSAGENAPAIKTRVAVSSAGTYDVWVNFWGVPTITADWRIKAGLSTNTMQLFRSMACKEVDSIDYGLSPLRVGTNNTFLYQAYLGRVQVLEGNTFEVFVDDSAIQVGTTAPLKGDVNRTWYDGVSYAKVEPITSVSENLELPVKFNLDQNYPNPFNPTTTITYSLPKTGFVDLKVYNLLGQEVATLVNKEAQAGTHQVSWNAHNMSSGVYLYKISVSSNSESRTRTPWAQKIKKMLLLK